MILDYEEHPITELVTGIDLVSKCLILQNKRLEITQNSIFNGWSFDLEFARKIKNNFLPSAGRIESFSFPKKILGRLWIYFWWKVSI